VDDSVDGFIIKHDDVKIWAQKILDIFNDKSLARKMGVMGRDKVSKKYSISKIVNDLEHLYKSIQK
jgi:glycosyltransferase involved in cell wall biosynthesis